MACSSQNASLQGQPLIVFAPGAVSVKGARLARSLACVASQRPLTAARRPTLWVGLEAALGLEAIPGKKANRTYVLGGGNHKRKGGVLSDFPL